jgi:pre-mRNA-splicing factor ATP-dependent RNA helicase DHX15/PRP43
MIKKSLGQLDSGSGIKMRKAEREVPTRDPTVNRWTNMKYSARYFSLLEKRKELPAWHAKDQIIEVVTKY